MLFGEREKMKQKTVNILFLLILLLGLLAALGRTLLMPKEYNYYENRYANRVAPLTGEAYLNGSFQDGMEDGLNDQIPGAQKMKKLYHLSFSLYQKLIAVPLAERLPDRYVNMGGLRSINGWLCYYPRWLYLEEGQAIKKAENYNAIFAAHPETEFYLYNIETDTNVNLENGERSAPIYEFLQERLTLPAENMGNFRIEDIDDYTSRFFRTDHHWNHRGSYEGYTQMLALVAPQEAPLEPVEEVVLGEFSGTKASGRELSLMKETFAAYRFDFPEMTFEIDGAPGENYCRQEKFFSGEMTGPTYGAFYGDDVGLVHIHTPSQAGKGNLLLLGDSYDNATIRLLASHFEHTYAVDLRYYSVFNGGDFYLDEFLDAHGIDRVLISGSFSFFVQDDFLLED